MTLSPHQGFVDNQGFNNRTRLYAERPNPGRPSQSKASKNGRAKEEALECGTFIINSRNKSEAKAEEGANSSQ